MWQKIKNAIYYTTRSSSDPEKMSLTVKGALIGILPFAISLAGAVCMLSQFCVDTAQFEPLINAIVGWTKAALELVAYTVIIVGIVRKIYLGRWNHPATPEA